MPLTLSPSTHEGWNDNKLSIVDGVSVVLVSVHKENDRPDLGTTVSIGRTEFENLCRSYLGIPAPTDND